MQIIHVDDIWELYPTHIIVIPTNLGWKKNGENVMGAGLALSAARKFPQLPMWYGIRCKNTNGKLEVCYVNMNDTKGIKHNLCLFPTKTVNVNTPWLSWKQSSSLELIELSTSQLSRTIPNCSKRIALPPPGCGNGGLQLSEILPILEKYLKDLPVDLIIKNVPLI